LSRSSAESLPREPCEIAHHQWEICTVGGWGAIDVAYDLRFYEKLPKLAPHNPGFRDLFTNNPELAEVTAKRNSTLQGAPA
jgi:hypothetical protein